MSASPEHEARRAHIAAEEGVGDDAERVRGHTEDELRADAIELRRQLGRGDESPTLGSAIAAMNRDRARRNALMRWT